MEKSAVLALLVFPLAAAGHHSTAEYDRNIVTELEGEVLRVVWRNPHVRLTIRTERDDGTGCAGLDPPARNSTREICDIERPAPGSDSAGASRAQRAAQVERPAVRIRSLQAGTGFGYVYD